MFQVNNGINRQLIFLRKRLYDLFIILLFPRYMSYVANGKTNSLHENKIPRKMSLIQKCVQLCCHYNDSGSMFVHLTRININLPCYWCSMLNQTVVLTNIWFSTRSKLYSSKRWIFFHQVHEDKLYDGYFKPCYLRYSSGYSCISKLICSICAGHLLVKPDETCYLWALLF